MIRRRPPRILHVVVGGDIGGAERLLVDLATRPERSRAAHEVALFTPNRRLFAFFADAGLIIHDRDRVKENPVAYLWRSLGPTDVRWLASVIRSQSIDVLHTHTFGSHVLGTRAARRANTPQIRTEHHVMHFQDASSSPFTRWAAARTDRFVAVSRYVQQTLAREAPTLASRTTVVRNGVDTTYFSPRPLASADGPLRLAIVCRLTAWKRVDLAVEAVALAGAELVVVGEGEERARLEELARERRARVRFVGYQRDPRPFVAECDATISTSDDEPLGLSVLESLAMERAVIAYAGGGIPEIVEHEGTGLLTSEATPAALARLIERAHADRDRLRVMGVAARRFALEHGSIESMCEGYAAEYERVARPS